MLLGPTVWAVCPIKAILWANEIAQRVKVLVAKPDLCTHTCMHTHARTMKREKQVVLTATSTSLPLPPKDLAWYCAHL